MPLIFIASLCLSKFWGICFVFMNDMHITNGSRGWGALRTYTFYASNAKFALFSVATLAIHIQHNLNRNRDKTYLKWLQLQPSTKSTPPLSQILDLPLLIVTKIIINVINKELVWNVQIIMLFTRVFYLVINLISYTKYNCKLSIGQGEVRSSDVYLCWKWYIPGASFLN